MHLHSLSQAVSCLALVAAALALRRASNADEEVDDGSGYLGLREAYAAASELLAVTAITLIAETAIVLVTKCSNIQLLDWTHFLVQLLVS